MNLWQYMGIDDDDQIAKTVYAEHQAKSWRCPGMTTCRLQQGQTEDLMLMQAICARCWYDALERGEVTIKCAE